MKLEIKNLSKKFKDVYVLKDINLTFESGKIYGFTGRNGSGKSVLCGFYTPTSGEVLLDNYNYILNNDFPKSTRCLIEKPNFLPDLTGYENLKLLASIENKIGNKEIMDTIEKLNLKEEINKKYSKYSLGTKQKLGIAQVLMEDPKLIVLDEPLNGIENETAKEVRKILNEEKKKDKIIIVASHIKEDIDTLADVVYNIDNGIVEKIKG